MNLFDITKHTNEIITNYIARTFYLKNKPTVESDIHEDDFMISDIYQI